MSHSGNYQLRSINWENFEDNMIIDYVDEYPDNVQDFSGLYGYNFSFSGLDFINNEIYLFTSTYKA